MIPLLLNLLILLIVFGAIWLIINLLPLRDPFPLIIRIVFAVILVIVLIDMLTGIGGGYIGRPFYR